MSLKWEDDFGIDGLNERIHAKVPAAAVAGMEVIRAITGPKVPVLTGNLEGSGGITFTGTTAEILYPGPYARYQEFGVYYRHGRAGAPLNHTHGQSFFLTTSLIEGRDAALQAVARSFEEEL